MAKKKASRVPVAADVSPPPTPPMKAASLATGADASPAAEPPAQESFLLSPPGSAPLSSAPAEILDSPPTPPEIGVSAPLAAEAALPPVPPFGVPPLGGSEGDTINQSGHTSPQADGLGLIQPPPVAADVSPPHGAETFAQFLFAGLVKQDVSPPHEAETFVPSATYLVGAGRPSDDVPRYYTPQPPNLR